MVALKERGLEWPLKPSNKIHTQAWDKGKIDGPTCGPAQLILHTSQ